MHVILYKAVLHNLCRYVIKTQTLHRIQCGVPYLQPYLLQVHWSQVALITVTTFCSTFNIELKCITSVLILKLIICHCAHLIISL